jgi:hypothetical protein
VKRTVSVTAGTTAPPTDIAVQQFTAPNTVTVTATSQADPSKSASATVTIATLIVRALGVGTTAGSVGVEVKQGSSPRLLLVGQGIVQGTFYEITGSGVQVIQPSSTDFGQTTDGTPSVRLFIVVSPVAALGPRNIIVTNSAGELSAFVGGVRIIPGP